MRKNKLAMPFVFACLALLVATTGCFSAAAPYDCIGEGGTYEKSKPAHVCCVGLKPQNPELDSTPCIKTIDWGNMVGAALALSFFAVVVIYMVGYGLGVKELESWAKNELFQVMATAVIVGAAVAIIGITQIITGVVIMGVDPTMPITYPDSTFVVADSYLEATRTIVTKYYLYFQWLNQLLGQWSSSVIPFMPNRVGFRFQPGQGLRPLMDAVALMLNTLGVALGAMQAQIILLQFVRDTMLPVFLPAGIIMRALPLTRNVGSVLIAVALGFYTVLPAMYAVNYLVLDNHLCKNQNLNLKLYSSLSNPNAPATISCNYGAPDADRNCPTNKCEATGFCAQRYQCSAPIWQAPKQVFNFLFKEMSFSGLFDTKMYEGLALPAFLLIMTMPASGILFGISIVVFSQIPEIIWLVFVLGFFLPLFNIFITLSFTRELARFMSSDVNLGSLAKIL